MSKDEAFNSMWIALVNVEKYIQHDIYEQLENSVSFSGNDMVPLHEAFQKIRNLQPYLSEDVLLATDNSLRVAQSGLNKYLDALRDFVKIPTKEFAKRNEAIENADQVLKKVLNDYKFSLKGVSNLKSTTLKRKLINYLFRK